MVKSCLLELVSVEDKADGTAFKEVLTVSQIRNNHIGKYNRKVVIDILYKLEKQGLTASYKRNKHEPISFYFDNNIKELLLKELTERGCKASKRVRPKVPTYLKFYPLYQYDRLKFRVLLNKWLKTEEGKNRTYESLVKAQARMLESCWVLDEYNQKKTTGDEKHIYRYKTYEAILVKIADYILDNYNISPKAEVLYYLYKRTGLVVYISEDERQAEIIKTMFRPLKERLKIHISLLRGLKKGLEIEQAVELALN